MNGETMDERMKAVGGKCSRHRQTSKQKSSFLLNKQMMEPKHPCSRMNEWIKGETPTRGTSVREIEERGKRTNAKGTETAMHQPMVSRTDEWWTDECKQVHESQRERATKGEKQKQKERERWEKEEVIFKTTTRLTNWMNIFNFSSKLFVLRYSFLHHALSLTTNSPANVV